MRVFLRKNAGRVRVIGINLGAQCAPRVFLILILVFFGKCTIFGKFGCAIVKSTSPRVRGSLRAR